MRLDGSAGGGTLCDGNCLEDTQYGTGEGTKLLTYQFPGGSQVQVATTEAWIKFTTAVEEVSQAGTRAVIYAVSNYRNIRESYGAGCASLTSLDNYRGYFGDEDYFFVYGPCRSEIEIVSGDSCNSTGYAWRLYHHTTNPWDEDAYPDCSDANSVLTQDADNEYELWTQYEAFEPGHTYNIDYSNQDLLSTYSTTFTPCDGQPDPPPISTRTITVSDPTGIIHTGSAPSGVTSLPTTSIVESGATGAYLVQSAEYPEVWYTVPLNYSSCECGDFNQQVSKPARNARSWVGSTAGPFNPCKHIMAVKRLLRISQSFDDYVPYPQNLGTKVVRYTGGRDNGRLNPYR